MTPRAGDPFVTERARERAPRVIDFMAAEGAAALISPQGTAVLAGGTLAAPDVARLTRVARSLRALTPFTSFVDDGLCVYSARVLGGWSLVVIRPASTDCGATTTRVMKAARVLELALLDGRDDGGGGPTPAVAALERQRRHAPFPLHPLLLAPERDAG